MASALALRVPSCRHAGSPLAAAAAASRLADVAALLGAGVDPNETDPSTRRSPLAAAARAGQIDAIARLVRWAAHPDRPSGGNGWTPLLHAIHKDRLDSMRALVASWSPCAPSICHACLRASTAATRSCG